MAILFFDTSALVRRYDSSEPGSGTVESLCDNGSGNEIVIARLTSVEMSAAFNRKHRLKAISKEVLDEVWDLFSFHCRQEYQMVELIDEITEQAELLPFRLNLRAYDSVQLATALWARNLLASLNPDFQFCTADRTQAAAAEARGLAIQFIV